MLHDRLYLRRRRDRGWPPSYRAGRRTREDAVETGYRQVAQLTGKLEAHTGASLASLHALDFGCGWGRLALPLAKRCEHVYGLDVAPSVLQEAERNAKKMKVSNVEWLDSGKLAELSGRYDVVISMFVFQHIPVREGERILAMLVEGLRAGGMGAIHVVLRPSKPWARLFRRVTRSMPPRDDKSMPVADEVPNTFPIRRRSRLHALRGYRHMLMGSYSLDRLGRLLADCGVAHWRVDFARASARSHSFDEVTIIFAKD
jgi:trans-aconitate methyltransferase